MGGPVRTVLRQGEPNTYNSCGQWLNHIEPVGGTILGFIHNETACRYQLGQTHKSMSLATSSDYGLTWKSLGQIITGTDAPAVNKTTGEGDCTAVNGRTATTTPTAFGTGMGQPSWRARLLPIPVPASG
jgi:hypothetical protein